MNECMNQLVSERTNGCINGWLIDWNEWMNE